MFLWKMREEEGPVQDRGCWWIYARRVCGSFCAHSGLARQRRGRSVADDGPGLNCPSLHASSSPSRRALDQRVGRSGRSFAGIFHCRRAGDACRGTFARSVQCQPRSCSAVAGAHCPAGVAASGALWWPSSSSRPGAATPCRRKISAVCPWHRLWGGPTRNFGAPSLLSRASSACSHRGSGR